jgi:hypothetical protein
MLWQLAEVDKPILSPIDQSLDLISREYELLPQLVILVLCKPQNQIIAQEVGLLVLICLFLLLFVSFIFRLELVHNEGLGVRVPLG